MPHGLCLGSAAEECLELADPGSSTLVLGGNQIKNLCAMLLVRRSIAWSREIEWCLKAG